MTARGQAWNAPGVRLAYAAADLDRELSDRIQRLRQTATRLPAELATTWDLETRAAELEVEQRFLAMALDINSVIP